MTDVELLGIGLTILGLVASIFFGVKSLKKRQSQRIKNNSVGIQSGRDTKINDR